MEDVLPTWYQNRFLPDGKMFLPNGTAIRRNQMKVPACRADNERFGTIEQKIREGTFSPDEAYVWAFKLHAGALALDARLNAANRGNPKFAEISVLELTGAALEAFQNNTVAVFRQLYHAWKENGGFDPSPLGSVFYLPSRHVGEFWYQVSPLGYVGFNLDTHYLAVALYDAGSAREEGYETHWKQGASGLTFGPLRSAPPGPLLFEGFWMLHMLHRALYTGRRAMLLPIEGGMMALPVGDMPRPISFEDVLFLHGPGFSVYPWIDGGQLRVGTLVAFQELLKTLPPPPSP